MRVPSRLILLLLTLSFPAVAAAKPHAKPGAAGNAPVIAQTSKGTYVEKGSGVPIALPTDVTLLSGEKRYEAGWHKSGRETLMGGKPGDPGHLYLDAARIDAGVGGRIGARSVDGSADFKATLVGLDGGVGWAAKDDPGSMNNFAVGASGDARIGADGKAGVSAEVGPWRAETEGEINAHLGAKTTGQISASPTLCGAQLVATASGQASLGIGGQAKGAFRADLAKMKFKIGGKVAATYGVGLGAGMVVEISAEKIMKDPRLAGRCFTDGANAGIRKLTEGYEQARDAGAKFAADVIAGWNFWRHGTTNESGSNVGRFEETRPLDVPQPSKTSGPAVGGGATR